MSLRALIVSISLISVSMSVGCASYATPGRGADLRDVGAPSSTVYGPGTDASIREAFSKTPQAKFPASVAVARVQAPGYQSYTAKGWGEGKFLLVTTRDVEKDEQFNRLSKLENVRGIAPLNRMLVDGKLDSDLPLRRAAAQLHADMLLIYTLDTTFTTQEKASPVALVTLGLSPTLQVRVTTTASAVLLDTRNGYVYGLAEATQQQNRFTSSWTSDSAIDESRQASETAAFDKLVGEFETTWRQMLASQAVSAGSARSE
jgi:hypothetical protein